MAPCQLREGVLQDPRIEEAAQDLYASPMQTFWKVTFPLILPGIAGAAMLAFSLSFDDFIITNLNSGQAVTFPMFVWGSAQRGVPMQVNVVGSTLFLEGLSYRAGAWSGPWQAAQASLKT